MVPNFNHGALVGEAIRALARQQPAADEILVVDDASTDDSVAVLERLRLDYPTLRIIRLQQNRGAIFALNRGLEEARGKFVYFGAADDVTLPGLFAAMLDGLERYPQAAFASCEAAVENIETGTTTSRPPVRPSSASAYLAPADVVRLLKRIDNWILTGTAVVRRDLMSQMGGFDASLGAFADSFVFRQLSLLHGCYFAPRQGVIWRTSAGGLSRSQAADPTASMRTLATALERMRADPAFPDWYPPVFERRWRFAVGRIAAQASPMNQAMLLHLCPGPVGRTIVTAGIVAEPVRRIAILVWMTLLERPTSLYGLVRTYLSRV